MACGGFDFEFVLLIWCLIAWVCALRLCFCCYTCCFVFWWTVILSDWWIVVECFMFGCCVLVLGLLFGFWFVVGVHVCPFGFARYDCLVLPVLVWLTVCLCLRGILVRLLVWVFGVLVFVVYCSLFCCLGDCSLGVYLFGHFGFPCCDLVNTCLLCCVMLCVVFFVVVIVLFDFLYFLLVWLFIIKD